MRLCDTDIERYLDDGIISLTPRPDNDKINGATIDVRLGNSFRVFREHSAPYIDLSGPKEEVSAQLESVMSDEIIIGDDEAFFLHPGMLALATTLESVKLPANIIGWLDGRSSLARLGLMVHVTCWHTTGANPFTDAALGGILSSVYVRFYEIASILI